MAWFRSKRDIEFVKRINRELIERVIGEKVTYYPISKQYSEKNFYGESKTKIVDPPVEIYGLIDWQDQNVDTTKYGQDIQYNIEVYFLYDHLDRVQVEPVEGDMIDYDNIKFEILSVTVPKQIFGKSGNDIGVKLDCLSVRENTFKIVVSGTVDYPPPTPPDAQNKVQVNFDNVKTPNSSSFYL